MTRWLDKSGHPIPGLPELPVEKAAKIKIISKKDPVPLDLLLRSNLVQRELSRMNINSISLFDKTVQVTPQVMRMLGGLLETEVTRDDPEWRRSCCRDDNTKKRDCRTIVQQLVSSIPKNVLTSTSYKCKEQVKRTQKKTVTFEEQDQWVEEVERNLEQD